MKKILSFFLALTATVAVNATVVTFEFADPTTYGFTAPAQGAYTQVESGASIAKDNVTIVPTFDAGKNGMRFTAHQTTGVINLRGYVGTTLVITAPNNENIVSISMAGSNLGNEYITAANGTLSGAGTARTWAGSANAVTLNIIKSTVQFNQIVVTYGEDAPVIPDCDFDTLTVTQAIARIANNQLCACIVKGRVKSIITTDANIAQYGNVDMWIEDATNALDTLKAFRLDKGANSLKFTNRADLDATFAVGDVIYMYANALMNYNDTKAGTTYAEINTGYFFKKEGEADPLPPVVVPADTVSVAQALDLIAANDKNSHNVKGVVTIIDAQYLSNGNINVTIADVDDATKTIYCYRMLAGKGTNFSGTVPFSVGDTIIVYGKTLKDYNGTKELADEVYLVEVIGGGTPMPEPEPCVLDTVSVTEALALIQANNTCPHVVKGRVLSFTEVDAQYGNTTVWLADETNTRDSIMAYRMLKGADGEKFANTMEIPFMVGDIIYVYGGKLMLYNGTPELSATNNVYYFGREGQISRIWLDFDEVALEEDFGQVLKLSKANATSPKFEYEITLADDAALGGTYDVVDGSLTYQDAVVPVGGDIQFVVDSMIGNEIYYSILLDLVDAGGMHYLQIVPFHSPEFLNDNPNVTAALAYEIGMALASGENTEATYNVYGFATGYYAKSKGVYQYWDATYKNHSFYISNVQGATRGFFEGYRVGPTSGNAADTAQFGDLIVFKGVQIKNYNGTIENNAAAKYDKVTSSTPVLRDVEAPEITVSEALTIESLTANYQMSKKYYTVCGLAADDADNNGTFHMAQGTDTIEAYKCVSPAGHAVKKGDNVKVRTLLECYNGKIQCYYGSVEGASVTGIEDVIRDSAVKAQKIVMDGQIVIVKDGILYNVLGIRLED